MPDAGFSDSSGAKGGLVPLLLLALILVVTVAVFVVTVIVPN